jgi:hypothetical protein
MFATIARETLVISEFPRYTDVAPFSVARKPLKMKESENHGFSLSVL